MAAAKKAIFQPVNLIPAPRGASDELALKMVYSLYGELVETMDTERSRQQSIGISEIGMDCRRCVARKLSMEYVKVPDPSWKAQVGTFMHAGFEDHFDKKYANRNGMDRAGLGGFLPAAQARALATDERPLYIPERRVHVLSYKGLELGGSCDLFIQGASFGVVNDWKTQGLVRLRQKTAKGDIGNAYTVQMHTYGLGYELLGYNVTHVLLFAVPRDGDLEEARPVLARYDRRIAVDALAAIQKLIDAAEIAGWDRVISAQPKAGFCFECNRYDPQESDAFLRQITK